MTQIINMTGSRFAINTSTEVSEKGAVTLIKFFDITGLDVPAGTPIHMTQLEAAGLEPAYVIVADDAKKLGVLNSVTASAYNKQGAAEVHVAACNRVTEKEHIEEMARVLADRQRKYEAKYGPINKGPQHAANMDGYAHSVADAICRGKQALVNSDEAIDHLVSILTANQKKPH